MILISSRGDHRLADSGIHWSLDRSPYMHSRLEKDSLNARIKCPNLALTVAFLLN